LRQSLSSSMHSPYTTLFRSSLLMEKAARTCYSRPDKDITVRWRNVHVAHAHQGWIGGFHGCDRRRSAAGRHPGGGWQDRRCRRIDRKSTRLNSSHVKISYAV